MKNKLIYILLSALLLMVSMVSAYLGEELVTCGDFTCDTDWVGFTPIEEYNWTHDDLNDFANFNVAVPPLAAKKNLSQAITIQSNRIYNITIVVDSADEESGLSLYLGGVKKLVFSSVFIDIETFSFNITTLTNDGLFLEGSVVGDRREYFNLNSISVKEVIEPPFGMIHQLKKPKGDTNKGMIVQLKRDESAIANGIIGMIVQLKRLLRI